MTRDEENRRLALWVGWIRHEKCQWTEGPCWLFTSADHKHYEHLSKPPDFRTDEAANAQLLEKMPSATLSMETLYARRWSCWPLGLWLTPDTMRGSDPDRMTATVKAALAYLEAQNGNPG